MVMVSRGDFAVEGIAHDRRRVLTEHDLDGLREQPGNQQERNDAEEEAGEQEPVPHTPQRRTVQTPHNPRPARSWFAGHIRGSERIVVY